MILLDTSYLSQVFRRKQTPAIANRAAESYARLVRESAPLAVPAIVAQELLSGLRTNGEFLRMSAILDGFSLIFAGRADHWLAAQTYNSCAANGIAVSTVDCLVSALAIQQSAKLATLDEDFARISTCSNLKLLRF